MVDANSQQNLLAQVNHQNHNDKLFNSLFFQVFNNISNEKGKSDTVSQMDEYTSNFFKIVIRIFQTSRKFFDLQNFKVYLDKLISNNKLIVVVNSIPLYLVTQMFYEAEKINESETGTQSIIFKVEAVINQELNRIKEGSDIQKPMLTLLRLKNLIKVSTTILQYFLCFQTPFSDKSSSSQIHSNNSQQYNLSPVQGGKDSSQKSRVDLNQSQPELNSDEVYENTFIVKKQKHCNFCGEILPYPTKFSFSRKCNKCAMKNSTLLLPARFLCNMCVDHSRNDLF